MRWTKVLMPVLVVSIIGLLGFGLTVNPDDVPSPLVDEAAPAFALLSLDDSAMVSLEGLKGRPVVVNFWASWCLACIQEHPALVRAWERYSSQGVEILGVLYQDTPENARRYIRERGGGWTQLLDPGTRTAIDYGVYGVPETFFIDRDGVIAHKHIGPVDDEVMYVQIESILRSPGSDGVEPGENQQEDISS